MIFEVVMNYCCITSAIDSSEANVMNEWNSHHFVVPVHKFDEWIQAIVS
jgi:hypothetical protein